MERPTGAAPSLLVGMTGSDRAASSLPVVIGRRAWTRPTSIAVLGVVYGIALGAGYLVAEAMAGQGVLWALLAADVAATIVVFLAALVLDNTSTYDSYWSVAPLALALWWFTNPDGIDASGSPRFALVAIVLGLWGLRLTGNFLRGWGGLNHEDWRYTAYRRHGAVRYWLISLSGLQMMPTLLVFGAMLPVYALTREPGAAVGWLDGLAAAVALSALALESVADEQRRRFAVSAGGAGFIRSGVWAWSRHPNYLGEVAFWWGIFLFGLAAGVGNAWTVIGAVAMTALFWFVSIPLMERRMRQRRPGYTAYAERVPRLFPRVPR